MSCCRHTFFAYLIAIVLTVILCVCFGGCKTVQSASHSRDSIRVEYRLDSVYVYQHDSIFRDRRRSGDTVYVTVEKWQTRYKDKLREVHDTIRVVQTNSVTVSVPRERSGYDKFTSWFFWVVLVLLLAWGAFKVCDKIPATKPYTTMIKGLFKKL